MATYNSAQNGNWNTDATWTEAGHPNANDDVMIVAHDVTYDAGDSAITWGNLTLNSGGVLIMPTAANSTLLFNTTGILTVNSGGELRAGTSGTPIGSSYHCYFQWPQGSAIRNVLVLNDGGTINIYGDSAFYGSERYADLDANWTSGQVFYITGDYASKWQAGQKFYIHENIDYDNYQNDGHIYTITTVGSYDAGNDRTPITITEVAPGLTFTAIHATTNYQSKLILINRNVTLCDPACPLTVYGYNSYTEMLRFDNNQAAGNSNIHFNDCLMYGWDRAVDGDYNFIAENIVFVNNYYVIYSGTNHQITGDFISNNYGIYSGTNHQIIGDFVSNNKGIYSGTNHQITGDFVSNYYGINYGTNHQITGDFVSNNIGIYYGTNYQITGDFVSNNIGIYSGTNYQITGDFVSNYIGINAGTNHQIIGDFVSNYYGINSGINYQITGDFVSNTIDVSLSSTITKCSAVLEQCALATVQRPLRVYENSGIFLPLMSGESNWQTPPSALSWILQAIPNSYCNADFYLGRMELSPLRPMAANVAAGSKTITFKIYPVGYAASIDQDDILIEAKYLSGASGNDRTTVETTTATFANDAWRNLTVTFTAGQDGMVYFNLYIRKYESACYVLIDPEWSIS